MSLLSINFLYTALLAVLIFYAIPRKWQSGFLLILSLLFFTLAGPVYLPLIFLLTMADFKLALRMKSATPNRRKKLLWLGLLLNVGMLLFFKYVFLVNILLCTFLPHLGSTFSAFSDNLLVPLGLSYFIFKKISYLLDCYWGRLQPEVRFARLLLYVVFFPEITAGPIDRAGRLLPQFAESKYFNRLNISIGLHQILWGLIKKLVIADRLAVLINPVFKQPEHYQAQVIITAILLFSIQIYSDFSGYSDIAIGLGRLFGYRLQMNFDRPYFALSISDFWTRWHISLSQWLRDYLFLPLSFSFLRRFPEIRIIGLKTEMFAYAYASLITMALCGLWHGSAWTFLFWGLLHGIYLIGGYFTRRGRRLLKKKLGLANHSALNRSWQRLVTFLLVSLSWIFFKSASLSGAFFIFKRLFTPANWFAGKSVGLTALSSAAGKVEFAVAFGVALLLFSVEKIQGHIRIGHFIRSLKLPFRWAIYYLVILAILFFGMFVSGEFVYQGF